MTRVTEAPETPMDAEPACLRTCGTAHRGHDPQCPVRWFEEGQKARLEALDRVTDLLNVQECKDRESPLEVAKAIKAQHERDFERFREHHPQTTITAFQEACRWLCRGYYPREEGRLYKSGVKDLRRAVPLETWKAARWLRVTFQPAAANIEAATFLRKNLQHLCRELALDPVTFPDDSDEDAIVCAMARHIAAQMEDRGSYHDGRSNALSDLQDEFGIADKTLSDDPVTVAGVVRTELEREVYDRVESDLIGHFCRELGIAGAGGLTLEEATQAMKESLRDVRDQAFQDVQENLMIPEIRMRSGLGAVVDNIRAHFASAEQEPVAIQECATCGAGPDGDDHQPGAELEHAYRPDPAPGFRSVLEWVCRSNGRFTDKKPGEVVGLGEWWTKEEVAKRANNGYNDGNVYPVCVGAPEPVSEET